jgi:hypothetical protein
MRIISGKILPLLSVFSMISMYSSSSFCTYLSSDGSTKRTMVMKICGICSPDSRMAMAFFIASAFASGPPLSSASRISDEEAARSKCTSIEHPRSTTALTVAIVAGPRVRTDVGRGDSMTNDAGKRAFRPRPFFFHVESRSARTTAVCHDRINVGTPTFESAAWA